MKKTFVATLFLSTSVICASGLYAQQKLNLDFETLSQEGISRPWGWSVYSYVSSVTYTCDTSTMISGKHSLKIKNNQKNNTSRFELSFFIEPSQILNSKISVEGWVKSENFVGKSGINLKSVGSIVEGYGILQENEVELQNSKDWKKYGVEINIGLQPHSVLVTLFFEGNGAVWFDNLQLKINNKRADAVAVAPKFSKEQLKYISGQTLQFSTVEPIVSPVLQSSDF